MNHCKDRVYDLAVPSKDAVRQGQAHPERIQHWHVKNLSSIQEFSENIAATVFKPQIYDRSLTYPALRHETYSCGESTSRVFGVDVWMETNLLAPTRLRVLDGPCTHQLR